MRLENTWINDLVKDYRGNIIPTIKNIVLILKNDELLKGIVYNTMTKNMEIEGKLPWNNESKYWSSTDNACLQMYLEEKYAIYAPNKYKEAMQAYYGVYCRKHPIIDFVTDLKWDGVKRMDKLLIDYLGAEDNVYVRSVTRKTLIAAISRVFKPGMKFDTVLVLCGPQGIGKSTFFSKLGKEWYSDALSVNDMKDKTGSEKLQGVWLMEVGELAGIKKADVDIVKAFLSRTDDQYRHTYGLCVESHPRTAIIVGTTNSYDGFLKDITGNRRFWPVNVNGNGVKKIWEISSYEIEQIWAEAYQGYLNGENLYLDKDVETYAIVNQTRALESDPRQGLVEEYLNTLNKDKICLMEIWCECLLKERQDMKKQDAFELESIIRKIGNWKIYDKNTTGKTRIEGYGVQKTFVRC